MQLLSCTSILKVNCTPVFPNFHWFFSIVRISNILANICQFFPLLICQSSGQLFCFSFSLLFFCSIDSKITNKINKLNKHQTEKRKIKRIIGVSFGLVSSGDYIMCWNQMCVCVQMKSYQTKRNGNKLKWIDFICVYLYLFPSRLWRRWKKWAYILLFRSLNLIKTAKCVVFLF